MVALDTFLQKNANKTSSPLVTRLMTTGFLLYTLLILVFHIIGFPLGYSSLFTVCPSGCSLTQENVSALHHAGYSITAYANFYMAIQVLYIVTSVGVGLLIVFKKPGQWIPLGLSCFLIGLSAYEGVDYPALTTVYPVLYVPTQLLINLGMTVLGAYVLVTFPNGVFGSRWVLGFYFVNLIVTILSIFITTNPVFVSINDVFSLLEFPIILGILIYRYRHLLNTKERVSTKWLIVSFSIFIPSLLLIYFLLPAIVPADSLAFLAFNTFGFFGCGINIAGFLMAVLYANAFDIDIFIRSTLVYTLLTTILVLVYTVLVVGSQFTFASFDPQVGHSPLILIGSTLIIAALFQPLRHRLQQTVNRRFYRSKYDAAKTVETFNATLNQRVDLDQLREDLLAVVQETMQPVHVSLWLRSSKRKEENV